MLVKKVKKSDCFFSIFLVIKINPFSFFPLRKILFIFTCFLIRNHYIFPLLKWKYFIFWSNIVIENFVQIIDSLPSWDAFLGWVVFNKALLIGLGILFFLIGVLSLIHRGFRLENQFFSSFLDRFSIIFEIFFERIFDFFNEIVWEQQKYWVKSFVIWIFFVVLMSNVMGTLFDFIGMMFPGLEEWVSAPTTLVNFNVAIAMVSVGLMLYLQFKKLGFGKFLYEYVPIFGKGIITIEKGDMSPFVYYPLFVFVKLFDILISLFVGVLDIIGTFAKVVSLSFRLYGNMLSGTILLGMLVVALKEMTKGLIWMELPLVMPLLVVIQGLFVAVIQAFVFSLLTAISIKVVSED